MTTAQLSVSISRVSFIGLLSAGLLVGCATTDDSARGTGEDEGLAPVSIEQMSHVTAQLDTTAGLVALPMDAFSLDERFGDKWSLAFTMLAESCLRDQGIPFVASQVDWGTVVPRENRLFGQWTLSDASQFGIDMNPNRGVPARLPQQQTGEAESSLAACGDQARQELSDVGAFFSSPHIDYQIKDNAYYRVLEHPDAISAIADRTECLHNQGLKTNPDSGFLADEYSDQDLSQQVAAATTFVDCQLSTGAIQTLFNLQARYETAYIQEYEAQLNALLEESAVHLEKLDSIIQGAS